MPEADPLSTPNCLVCLRPMEAVEQAGVVMWSCGYGCDKDVKVDVLIGAGAALLPISVPPRRGTGWAR